MTEERDPSPEIREDAEGEFVLCPRCGAIVREGEDEFDGDTLRPTGQWRCYKCGWHWDSWAEEDEE